jgi:hypothetical protein
MKYYQRELMYMSGGRPSIKVVLRNPLNYNDKIDYNILPHDNSLAQDWIDALKQLLRNKNLIEKDFCFLGFPHTARTTEYLCNELNQAVSTINNFFSDYKIHDYFTPDNVLAYDYAPNGPNHELLNQLHNHFEILQGTVWELSDYYIRGDYETKYAIRQLNTLCHELESLILSKRKFATIPQWVRPSQITTFINAARYDLKFTHRQLFAINGYDRVLGGVYMHWSQIGKTLFEVFRDENAPDLTETVCQSITELKYYSGEFDVEWGNSVVYGNKDVSWHTEEQNNFREWLSKNGRDYKDVSLSCGYLPIGQVDLQGSFGNTDGETIWKILGNYLDIYSVEVDGVTNIFDYSWADADYKQIQINRMKPGYDYSSRR